MKTKVEQKLQNAIPNNGLFLGSKVPELPVRRPRYIDPDTGVDPVLDLENEAAAEGLILQDVEGCIRMGKAPSLKAPWIDPDGWLPSFGDGNVLYFAHGGTVVVEWHKKEKLLKTHHGELRSAGWGFDSRNCFIHRLYVMLSKENCVFYDGRNPFSL